MRTRIFLKYSIPADSEDGAICGLSRDFSVTSWHKGDGEGGMVHFEWCGHWYSVPASNVLGIVTRKTP